MRKLTAASIALALLISGCATKLEEPPSQEEGRVQTQRMTRVYPVYMTLPEDFPPDMRKVGLAATIYIHTEGAGVVGIVAIILQWIGTSMDAII